MAAVQDLGPDSERIYYRSLRVSIHLFSGIIIFGLIQPVLVLLLFALILNCFIRDVALIA